jgi:hypothetical protein
MRCPFGSSATYAKARPSADVVALGFFESQKAYTCLRPGSTKLAILINLWQGPKRVRRRKLPVLAAMSLFALATASPMASRPAQAQSVQHRLQNDFGDLLRYISDLASQVGTKSRGEMLSFLNKIELFNVESEIDRLAGNPWELSDSTQYKLGLAPLHLAYPVFDQYVRQMTRMDDIKSRRIQYLTVDALDLITVNLDILSGEITGGQLANSLIRYFNAREFIDLGVFLLAQQPFFPESEEAWNFRKHQIASHEGALAVTVAGLGALFEVGAISNSGTIKRCQDNKCRVGWYGGFSHLGYHLQPNLRGGFTTQLPWLEVSAGLMEQIRPSSDSVSTVFEMAVRESWLNEHITDTGWQSFMEAAVRRVLAAESRYQGENLTTRGGLFIKRERPFKWRHITLRGSTEVESNMTGSLRYAMGFGVDYTKTGLSTVLQSSRTNISHEDGIRPETRTGLFMAGTIESPEQYYVEAMQVKARLLQETWQHLVEQEELRRQAEAEMRVLAGAQVPAYRMSPVFEKVRRATAEGEAYRVQIATLLGDYLEGRRIAYSLKQWNHGPDDLHGPVEGEVLKAASDAVRTRLLELAAFLQRSQGPLSMLRDRYGRTNERLQSTPDDSERSRDLASDEMSEIDQTWRRESEAVTEGLRLYNHYLASTRRIANIAHVLMPIHHIEPLNPRFVRKLLTLAAQPLR